MSKIEQVVEGAPKARQSNDEQLKELEIQAKQLELLERQANLEDIKERLAEREMKRDQTRLKARTNGATLSSQARDRKQIQDRCNHRKGGDGAHGVIGGQGHDQYYSVIKHTLANGDMIIRCMRCRKMWMHPIRSQYTSDNAFDQAMNEYNTAKLFLTNNRPSTSGRFQWSDGGEYYRELVSAGQNPTG